MSQYDKPVCLIGYSGHGMVVAEAAILSGLKLNSYAEKCRCLNDPFKLEYLGNESAVDFKGWIEGAQFMLGIGNNDLRWNIATLIRSKGFDCLKVIHPDSRISRFSEIGSGSFVARNAAINPMCWIRNDVIVNTSASVDHDCVIEKGAHIAPGAVLAGNVVIGEKAFVGANAVIKQGVTIGKDAVVGAGAVVLDNVPDNAMVYGNPARIKKTEE